MPSRCNGNNNDRRQCVVLVDDSVDTFSAIFERGGGRGDFL
jgi:hypothetical protein